MTFTYLEKRLKMGQADDKSQQYLNSTLRERVVEHIFVGEALRRLWELRITDVEVLRSEFDAGGYDLVMSVGKVVRHIQFKTATVGSAGSGVNVNLKLADKPSGCVVWIVVKPDNLDMTAFRWFGGSPGEALPDIRQLKAAKHPKGNAQGVKAERPNHRVLPKSRFETLASLDDVLARLFGPLVPGAL